MTFRQIYHFTLAIFATAVASVWHHPVSARYPLYNTKLEIDSHRFQAKREVDDPDIGPDTCGQDRIVLGNWFMSHGSPDLIMGDVPDLVLPPLTNPYDDPSNPPIDPDSNHTFCGMQWQNMTNEKGLRKYQLKDFASEEAAAAADYVITHKGHCGSCSSLQDLGVYMRQNLTRPARLCGMQGMVSQDMMVECLKEVGLSDNCTPIWAYNVINTRSKCFWICFWAWLTQEPLNKPDGSLNDCLQCDEDISGPNFKHFSGRTRRNSGIPSSIIRPPDDFFNIAHCYWYGDLSPHV